MYFSPVYLVQSCETNIFMRLFATLIYGGRLTIYFIAVRVILRVEYSLSSYPYQIVSLLSGFRISRYISLREALIL